MDIKQIIRLTIAPLCVAVGLYLAISGYRAKDTTGQKIKKEFTGNYSHHVKQNIFGGIALVVVGAAVFYFVRGRK